MAYAVNYKRQVLKHREALAGTVVCIDPASGAASMPGFAVFVKGQLVRSGVLPISPANIQLRLVQLRALLASYDLVGPDVLVIEKISGRLAHPYLIWSVGVTVEATWPQILIEIPVAEWKPYAKADPHYTKTDEADAICIGRSIMDLAGLQSSPRTVPSRGTPKRQRATSPRPGAPTKRKVGGRTKPRGRSG